LQQPLKNSGGYGFGTENILVQSKEVSIQDIITKLG